mmetsp:Transcript_18006/g.15932  ORF Transcript_18006/g.15932 Transcript_18006/m.15932 type:complete len:108 (+) Transcript_18006:240-563(+)
MQLYVILDLVDIMIRDVLFAGLNKAFIFLIYMLVYKIRVLVLSESISTVKKKLKCQNLQIIYKDVLMLLIDVLLFLIAKHWSKEKNCIHIKVFEGILKLDEGIFILI